MPKGKKVTGRTMPIYPRVTPKSSEWLNKATKYTGKSQSEIVDFLLWKTAVHNNSRNDIKNFFGLGECGQPFNASEA